MYREAIALIILKWLYEERQDILATFLQPIMVLAAASNVPSQARIWFKDHREVRVPRCTEEGIVLLGWKGRREMLIILK